MNLKLAKRIRKILRKDGVDPRQTTYVQRNAARTRIIQVGVNLDGTPKNEFFTPTGTQQASQGCGRYLYNQFKRVNK